MYKEPNFPFPFLMAPMKKYIRLTHSCLVNLIDVTLASEDANSKLVMVVTVADVDAEDHAL